MGSTSAASKTVIIVGFFPPPITGQKLATQQLVNLLSDEYNVHTVNLNNAEHELVIRSTQRLLGKIRDYRQAGKRLKTALAEFPGATVLWTSVSPQPLGHIRDYLTVRPAFLSTQLIFGVVHWGKFHTLFKSPLTCLTAKPLLGNLSGLVFLNEDRASQCDRWVPPAKRFIVPNSLDEACTCSSAEIEQKYLNRSSRTGQKIELLFLSHMIREKGYLDVLEATRLLRDEGVPVHATFVGQWLSGADQESFDQYVQRYSLNETITHLGVVSDRAQVKSLHLNADVFLLPSYLKEGQPLTIIEAFNAATPVVTTRLGGMVEMISEKKNGCFVAPQDPQGIADSVKELSDPGTWADYSSEARKAYLLSYSPESVKALWSTIIDSH